MTVLTQVQKLLSGYVVGVQPQARPAPLFRTDWREQLNAIVQAISVKQNVRQSEFGRTEIMLTLAHARAAGLLDIRNFIDYFSEYFDISRATVYNYLKATPKE